MNNFIKKNLTKNKQPTYFLLFLVLYIISFIAKFNFGTTFFGIPLIFYFPGMFIVGMITPIQEIFGAFGKFSLSVMFSFCLSSIIGLIIQNVYGFNSNFQILAIILINIIAFLINLLKIKFNFSQKKEPGTNNTFRYTIIWQDYIPIIIFLFAMLSVFAFNPFSQNLDNYLSILKLSISQNRNILEARQIFISSIGLTSQVLKLDVLYVYACLFMLLFLVSTLTFYDYLLRHFKARNRTALPYIIYLTFLISPAILTEVNRTMAQVALLCLTIPSLILSIESIKNKKISLSLIALFLAFVSLLFHELGAILVITSFITILIDAWWLFIVDKESKRVKIVILIILSVAAFLAYRSNALAPIIQRVTFRIQQSVSLISQNNGIHWRWWFLNNYKTVEGIQLGWTGTGALMYYLYGGILLFLPLIVVSYFCTKNKAKIGLEIIPPLFYFLFYFAVAELFPRMNLAFLPNRAWVHMMLPAVIILALVCEQLNIRKIKIRYFEAFLITLIAIGYVGTVYLAKINLYEVYPSEMAAANYIKTHTPPNAVILSSQNNRSLIDLYAKRAYGQIVVDHQLNKNDFESIISNELKILSSDQIADYDPNSLQDTKHYIFDKKTGKTVTKASYSGQNAVFFLYSYAKIGGLNDKRPYRQDVVDSINQSTYNKLGYTVVYSDPDTILIKIK